MTIYIDPTHTPARLLRKAYTGDSLISLKSNGLHTLTLKHHDQLPLDIVIINRKNVSNLRIGAKLSDTAHSSANATLLALGEDAEGSVEGNSTRFSLILNLNTEALNQAFAEDACHIFALTEITWQEESIDDALNISTITRISETLPTIIYNDILRGSESIPAIDSHYPVAEAIATKDWVQQEQSSQNEEFASTLQSALYASETSTISSRTGNDNISCDWLQIAPKNIALGKLQSLRIKCRSNSSGAIETAPIYLHVWEEQTNGDYSYLATSTNAITQATSQWSIWDFNQTPLSGRSLRLYASTDPNDRWSGTFASLGCRCIARTSDDTISLINTLGATGDINHEAETQFTIQQTLPHFADRNTATLINAHTSAYHATQDELNTIRDRLTALESNPAQNLPSWANCIVGSAEGISEIKLYRTASITSSNSNYSNSRVEILSTNTAVNTLSTLLTFGDSEKVEEIKLKSSQSCHIEAASEIALVAGELQVDATAINYLNAGNKAYPAWLDTVEGDAEGISRLVLKPNGAGISTTPTASHSLGIPLLQYIQPYGSESQAHMYLGAHNLEIMRISTSAGDVYQGEIKTLLS